MAVGCGANFAKIILIIFNFIFLASGIVLMALGIWLLVTLAQDFGPAQIFKVGGETKLFQASGALLIAMGCFILIVTIFGLVAAFRESPVLLGIYLFLIFLVFGGEIAGGVVAIVYKDKILDGMHQFMHGTLSNLTYYKSNQCNTKGTNSEFWDYAQYKLQCCGFGFEYKMDLKMGYDNATVQCTDSTNTTYNKSYPLTCCHTNPNLSFDPSNQTVQNFNISDPYMQSCEQSVQNWIIHYAPILIGIGIGFGMLEMFGVIFTVCLCMNTGHGFKKF